jgi:conjugal transfer pilus assembly protein TraV
MHQLKKASSKRQAVLTEPIFKIGRNLSVLGMAILLSACAAENSQFNCNRRGTGECASLDQVNQQASQGVFNQAPNASDSQTTALDTPAMGGQSTQTIAQNPGEPIRYSETVQRIWLSPYEDTNGNYHEPSYVYTVIQPGHWIGVPAKAINDNE